MNAGHDIIRVVVRQGFDKVNSNFQSITMNFLGTEDAFRFAKDCLTFNPDGKRLQVEIENIEMEVD